MRHLRNAALLLAVAVVSVGCVGHRAAPQQDVAQQETAKKTAHKYPADSTNLPASIFQGYNVTGSRF